MTQHPQAPKPLGQIYLPKSGSTVGTFEFIIAEEAGDNVEIDTPVAADTKEGVVIGVVTDMRTVGPGTDPMVVDISSREAERGFAPLAAHSGELKLASVQVFHSQRLRSISGGRVREVTPEEMLTAMGVDRIDKQVTAGVVDIGSNRYARAVLDMHTLLGPEAAHLMIGGLSGQAAKTSFAGVLLRSAIEAGSAEDDSVAALVFNVKGGDLVNLDQPPAAGYELTEDDYAMYEAMGIPATPFEDLTVFAPSQPGGEGTRSLRENAIPLRWDLRDVWKFLRYFSPGLYGNDNMVALLADIREHLIYTDNPGQRKKTFQELLTWFDSTIADAERSDDSTPWRNHHIATIRKAGKLIGAMPAQAGGLLTMGQSTHLDDVDVKAFRHRGIVVVDIAGLDPQVQAAVIARTCERVLESAEENTLGVDHLVIFADELNVFAPATGGEGDLVRKALTKISATGRYAGISLWGAAQFLSQVAPQITGNAATRAAGIVADSEVDSGIFGRLPAGQRERLVTLPKGAVALKAYNFRGLLTVRFPRPAWCTGKPKGAAGRSQRRAQVSDTIPLRSQSLERLTEGIDPHDVDRVVAAADGDQDKVVATLEKLREPDMRKVSVERTVHADSADSVWDL